MNRITNEKFISLRLRCALGDTGVSQRELARLTGITEVTLSRYVNGNRIPKATTLKKIADALGVGLDYFFTEEELKNSNEELNNSTDLVSRQAAIDALAEQMPTPYTPDGSHPADEGIFAAQEIYADCIETIKLLPTAQPEITDEQAILHLQSTGWMQNHDREMYESGLREQLADDSGAYDSLVSCEDAISRQAAIDFIDVGRLCNPNEPRWSDNEVVNFLKSRPSAQPDIIACGDCKHWICHDRRCGYWNHGVKPLDWCCHGERRTDG